MSHPQDHPELLPHETFLVNMFPSIGSDQVDISRCAYKSKRLGNIAYDIHGKPVVSGKPLFADKSEVDRFMEKIAGTR